MSKNDENDENDENDDQLTTPSTSAQSVYNGSLDIETHTVVMNFVSLRVYRSF